VRQENKTMRRKPWEEGVTGDYKSKRANNRLLAIDEFRLVDFKETLKGGLL